MPVLNEIDYVDAALDGVLNQEVEGRSEVIVALGPSVDGTSERVHERALLDSRIRFINNPAIDIPIGLNLAIRASRGRYVIRVDAHSELPDGYALRSIADLEETGAVNVGGLMYARGKTPFQNAVARAYNSRFGLGGGSYHHRGIAGPAESAYLGVFRREIFDEVGYFDETLKRGEDWELNLRIRNAGHLVWFDPTLEVTYWPRDTWSKLFRQFVSTGTWRGDLVRRYGLRNSLRYFAPPVLVVATFTAVLWGIVALAIDGMPVWPALLGAVGPALYLTALVLVGLKQKSISLGDRTRLVLVFITMHYAWGLGFLRGVVMGAGNTVDTSRVMPAAS